MRKAALAGAVSYCAIQALLGAPAPAQPGSGPRSAEERTAPPVEAEIIITARKREERLQDVPVTVNVLTSDFLTQINADNFGALDGQIPNFDFTSDRAARSTFQLRGFGPSTAVNQLPGVGIYVDGVYQTSTGFLALPFIGVERIEVLKGPQGTLYGRNAYAGAISIVTRRPTREVELHAEAEYSSGESIRAGLFASGPLVPDVLAASVSAAFQDSEGFFEFASTGEPVDHRRFWLIRPRVVFTPAANLEFDLIGSISELDSGSFTLHTPPATDPDPINFSGENVESNPRIFGDQDVYERKDYWSLALRSTLDLGGASIVSLTSYDDQVDMSAYDSDFSPQSLFNVLSDVDRELFSQELRLQSNGERRFRWLLGLYYASGDSITDTRRSGSFFGTSIVQLPIVTERFNTVAGFADIEFDVTGRLSLGFGLRYDNIEKTLQTTQIGERQARFSDLQPKFTVRWEATDDLMFFAHIARGFREGGFNANLINTPDEFFQNDSLWAYELGTRGEFMNGRGRFEVSAFLNNAGSYNVSNLVVINGVPNIATVNVGGVRTWGVEGSVSVPITNQFRIGGNFGVLRTERTRIDPRVPNGAALLGQPLTLVPEWSAAGTATYSTPLGNSGLTFNAVANISAKGATAFALATATTPAYIRDSFANIGFSLGVSMERWRLTLFGRNVFDERHAEVFQPPGQLASFGKPNAVVLYNEPAVFGIRGEIDF